MLYSGPNCEPRLPTASLSHYLIPLRFSALCTMKRSFWLDLEDGWVWLGYPARWWMEPPPGTSRATLGRASSSLSTSTLWNHRATITGVYPSPSSPFNSAPNPTCRNKFTPTD